MAEPISSSQFGNQSMSVGYTNPNIGKVVTGSRGAQFDFTEVKAVAPKVGAKVYGPTGLPTTGPIAPNRYPRETWQNYTSRPTSRWAQSHGGVMDRSGSAPVFRPFNSAPTPQMGAS